MLLWLLAVGFAGLTPLRLAEAASSQPDPDGQTAGKRLASLARAAFCGATSSPAYASSVMKVQVIGPGDGLW